jgi:hypothetical protein
LKLGTDIERTPASQEISTLNLSGAEIKQMIPSNHKSASTTETAENTHQNALSIVNLEEALQTCQKKTESYTCASHTTLISSQYKSALQCDDDEHHVVENDQQQTELVNSNTSIYLDITADNTLMAQCSSFIPPISPIICKCQLINKDKSFSKPKQ